MISLPAPYPLTWPDGRPRTQAAARVQGTYTARGYAEATATLEREVRRWQDRARPQRITDWQVTATHAGRSVKSDDPGASFWFVLAGRDITGESQLMVMACDKFTELPQNIRALSLTMERLRQVADVGAYSLVQAVEGARALPPPERVIDWREILGITGGSLLVAEGVYRLLAREAGEGSERLTELNLAIEAARKELKPRPPRA